VEWEENLGEQVLKQYRINHHFYDQKQAEQLLQPLVQPLLDANTDKRFTFRFHINRDEQVNAFALPGGYVVINSGLILRAETPEELLGVVAHEMAHVTEQHGMRNIIGSAGIYLTVNAILGDVSGLLALIADAAPFLLNQRYSRSFETTADEKGAALLLAANVDPRGLTRFFEKLKEEEEKRLKEMTGEDNQTLAKTTLSMISTHPATEDRIAHLEKITAVPKHATFRDLDEPFLHLQDAIKRFVTHSDQE
jgi:predicted Zn-dependent protease